MDIRQVELHQFRTIVNGLKQGQSLEGFLPDILYVPNKIGLNENGL